MFRSLDYREVIWVLTATLEVTLLIYLLQRRVYRSYRAFFIYILAVILQNIVGAFAYKYWGSQSIQSWNIVWGSQAIIIGARWLAVVEIARKVLADYAGIWGLASRILVALSLCALVYSMAYSRHHWNLVVLNADRAVELCIGTFIVCLFLFARYYRLTMLNPGRQLAIGFCLYSCSWVINLTVLENWPNYFGDLWDCLIDFAYIASLILWMNAVRKPVEQQAVAARMPLSPEMYGELSQVLDSRLRVLNSRLIQLLHSEDSRS